MEALNKLAEMVSLALTWPTVVLSLMVVVLWARECRKSLFAESRTATQWFIIGVAIGFAGSAVDNVYWGIAWFGQLLELESSPRWFRYGVYSNIPFRQVAGTVAAYCHVRSAFAFRYEAIEQHPLSRRFDCSYVYDQHEAVSNRALLWSLGFGVVFVSVAVIFF